MKNVLSIAMLLCFTLARTFGAENSGNANVVENGSFEAPKTNDLAQPLAGWTVSHAGTAKDSPLPTGLLTLVNDPKQAHSGNQCLRIQNTTTQKVELRSKSEQTIYTAGFYEASVWVRGKPGTRGYFGVAGLNLANGFWLESDDWRRISWTGWFDGREVIPYVRAAWIFAEGATEVDGALLYIDDVNVVRLDAGLADVFGDHMVLQRGKPLQIWGWARTRGQQVTVRLNGQSKQATADKEGRWSTTFDAMLAGGPYTVEVDNYTAAYDVMIGDVWLCAGQSNMEFGLDKLNGEFGHAPEVLAQANQPKLRLFHASQQIAVEPQRAYVLRQDGGGLMSWQSKWMPCTPASAAKGKWGGFSAVGYFFGRAIAEDQKVCIGLIQLASGGTSIEAWSSAECLKAFPQSALVVRSLPEVLKANPGLLQLPEGPKDLPSPALRDAVIPRWGFPPLKFSIDGSLYNTATACFNGQVAPVIPLSIKGVLWYQGEHNAGDVYYEQKLTAMIADLRKRFGQGEMPFVIAQLCNWKPSGTIAFETTREAQLKVAQKVPNTALAVTIDLADKPGEGRGPSDIHPRNKQEVARRMVLAARAIAYGEKVVASGPLYKSSKVEGVTIRMTFDHIGGGLVAAGGKLVGFSIAGADQKFVPAEAEISGDTVIVRANGISEPVAVRYCMSCFVDPLGTLQNKEGLPASPFRTDEWPLVAPALPK
jgi:sialate O-acetylesterase